MSDNTEQPFALQPMTITVTDKGQSAQVSDVQRWIDERKLLLKGIRELLKEHEGNAVALRAHHHTLVGSARRVSEIKEIFDHFNRERLRHADANIAALVRYFSDPKTLEGIDD